MLRATTQRGRQRADTCGNIHTTISLLVNIDKLINRYTVTNQ
jgi:hypothetical protein